MWSRVISAAQDEIPVVTVFARETCINMALCKLPPFSLSQIDRLYDWKKSPDTDVVATLKKQKKNTKDEFDERAKAVMLEFAQQVCPHSMPFMPRLYLNNLRRSFTGIL